MQLYRDDSSANGEPNRYSDPYAITFSHSDGANTKSYDVALADLIAYSNTAAWNLPAAYRHHQHDVLGGRDLQREHERR